jgi:hypothetical protein
MDTSLDDEKKRLAWSMIDQIIEHAINHTSSLQELGFCMTSILNIAKLSIPNDHIGVAVLSRLKSFISHCLAQTDIPSQFCSIINESVSMMIYLHGEYLNIILRKCAESRKLPTQKRQLNFDKTKEFSEEDASLFNDNEIERLVMKQCHQIIEYEIDCLSLLFDSLTMLLDPLVIVSLGAHQELGPFPIPKISPTVMQTLIKVNPKADLSTLLTKLNEIKKSDPACSDFELSVNQLINICTRLRGQSFGMKSNDQLHLYLEQAYLIALERFIQDFREVQPNVSLSWKGINGYNLIERLKEELVFLLDCRYGIYVQRKTFKCLGEFNLSRHVQTFYEPPTIDATILQNPLPNIYSATFSLLSDLIRSECTETAIAAKETAKALLCTKAGWQSWYDKNISSIVEETISPFAKNDALGACSHLTLSNDFLSLLAKRAEVNELEMFQDKSWCWNESLWCLKVDETITFEVWIQCLVCAIIICCYDTSEDGESSMVRGQSDFFCACLVLSSRKCSFSFFIKCNL